MAPEILKLTGEEEEENKYNYKCDLWSLGIIIYELYFKEKAFKGKTEYSMINPIESGKIKLIKTNDEKLNDLINGLLQKDPQKRLT